MRDQKSLSVFAPAKINLFLHLLGRERSGYHAIQSLIAFADIGDYIEIAPDRNFSFHIIGPFAEHFRDEDRACGEESTNLVVRAARALARATGKPLDMAITLKKELPLAAGLGGGSSDAAAVLWGLCQLWGVERDAPYIPPLMQALGADVPACLACRPVLARGIGEDLHPVPEMPEVPIVLANPLIPCATHDVFTRYAGAFGEAVTLPDSFADMHALVAFLQETHNDLYDAARGYVPAIDNVLHTLRTQDACLFARMSGSGASCFALFEDMDAARTARQHIMADNPDWWVQVGTLNRPQRY